jgi:hypothetical protein
MRTRPFLGVLTVSFLALLTVGTTAGRPQPGPTPLDTADKRDPGPPAAPVAPTPPIPPLDLPIVPGTQIPPAPSAPVAPATKPTPLLQSVEELLGELEKLRKQKAELEKQEQALVAKLHDRLKDQTDRLHKLGVAAAPAVAPPPARDFEAKDSEAPPSPKK